MRITECRLLTQREKDIVLYILMGKSKKEIAERLYLSVSTIKSNVENIYRKLDVHNKAQLIVYIIKNKMVDFESDN